MPRQKKPATSAKRPPKLETEIAFIEPPASDEVEIPEQKEHHQLPTRFGKGGPGGPQPQSWAYGVLVRGTVGSRGFFMAWLNS